MSLVGVSIKKSAPGASVLATKDGVSGLLVIVPQEALPTGMTSGEAVVLYSLADAEEKGLVAGAQGASSQGSGASPARTLVAHHLREFYKQAPTGSKLYVMLVASALTGVAPNQAAAVKLTDVFTEGSHADKLIDQSAGDMSLLAVASCVVSRGTAAVYVDGLPAEVHQSIAKGQSFADRCWDKHQPLHVVLEGRDYQGNASAVADLKKIAHVAAGNVSVVIGQDYAVAEGLTEVSLKKYAAVGTLLGVLSKRGVANNPGEVHPELNLIEVATGRWMKAGLSNHRLISEQRASLAVLDKKGYIFAVDYPPYDGLYFNDGHSCREEVKDSAGMMSISSVMFSRITNKVSRILYEALMPYVKRKFPTDSTTGKLPSGVIKEIELYAEDQLLGMVRAEEVSAVQVHIDPESDLLSGDKVLKVKEVRLIPYGYASEISVSLTMNTKS